MLRHKLFQALEGRWDRPALTLAGRLARQGPVSLTGEELCLQALAMAGQLDRALSGLAPVVVLALPPGVPFVTALFAALFSGICAVPVALPRAGGMTDRFARIVTDCGASALLCVETDKPLLEAALQSVPVATRPRLWSVDDLPGASPLKGPLPLRADEKQGTDRHTPPAIVQYTSGSSRFPRGAALTDEAILTNGAAVAPLWGVNDSTVMVNWLPHYHDMGLMGGLLYPLLWGGQVVQVSPLDIIQRPLRWLQAISDFGGTLSGGPTFAFARCLDHISDADCARLDLSSWSVAFCGAEPVPEAVLQSFREKFAPCGLRGSSVFACYGMAEYTLFAAGMPVPDGASQPGVSLPAGLEVAPCRITPTLKDCVRVVDPETCQPVADGQQGEIWLSGPSKANGYVKASQGDATLFDARLQNADDDRTWLRTGDLATLCDGALYVVGRLKETLIAYGRKVAAPELEWLAAGQHPALNPAAAAAFMTSPVATGDVVLMIEWQVSKVPSLDQEALARTIRQVVRGEWGIHLTEVSFLPRGSLPRTTSGKIRRSFVAQEYYARRVN